MHAVHLAEYGALKLTEAARPVLKGEQGVQLRRPHKAKGKASRPRTRAVEGLLSKDQPLFEALRAWRLTKAREQGVPAYVILHDKTLRQLASLRPDDAAALAEISGLGAAKREHYGAELLELIAEWAE